MYYDRLADLALFARGKVAIIGYGFAGNEHRLKLKDSGRRRPESASGWRADSRARRSRGAS